MADKAVGFGATDVFALGAGFQPQSSGQPGDVIKEEGRVLDSIGDLAAQTTFGVRTEHKVTYQYTGTDLDTDFDIFLGQVVESIHVDSISMKFERQSAVSIDITGHNHATNSHATGATASFNGFNLALTTLIGDTVIGWGVPADKPVANSDGDATCISMTLNWSLTHVDDAQADGDHFVGTDADGKVECEMTFLGIPTLTTTGWIVPSSAGADANQAHDTTTIKLIYGTKLAREVVPA